METLQQTASKPTPHSYEPQPTSDNNCITPDELKSTYRWLEEIGKGAQGHVYKAQRLSDHAIVAIKVLQIDSVQTWKEYTLFMREAEVLKNLNLHGVAQFYEALQFLDIPKPRAYIVQEYIAGRSLEEMIKTGYRFTLNRVFNMAVKLLDLLEHLHTHDPMIIHRDIKPSNILIKPLDGDDFDVYLIDFGAVANPQVQSGGSTIAGTFGYMPPEQLMGRPTPASDIYALAATLVYLCSGTDPSEMQVSDFRLIIEPHLENIPSCVVSVLRQMLIPNAANRLCDYTNLKKEFSNFANDKFQFTSQNSSNSDEIAQKIKKFERIGQPGSIDIWCALSESVPRSVPEAFEKFIPVSSEQTESINAYILPKRLKKNLFELIFPFVLFFTFLSLLIIADKITVLKALPLSIIALICIFISYGYYPFNGLEKGYILRRDMYVPVPISQPETNDYYLYLLQNGCKTIATILSIEYQLSKDSDIENYFLTQKVKVGSSNSESIVEMKDVLTGYCHRNASFKLTYKFNPPDDASTFDLVHSITIHNLPDQSLKPGDPLPILYAIDKNNRAMVQSMPYPFPMNAIDSFEEIIAHSCQE